MSQVQRIIIRTGLQADVPALLTAEMGWDYDKKTLRVGDATSTPPKIMSTKSLGDFDFSSTTNVTFRNILLSSGGTFDGMDLSSLNDQAGLIARATTAGTFVHTSIASSDGSLQITNGSGTAGAIDVVIDPDLLTVINSFEGVVSVAQPSAPTSFKAGDLWCDTDTDVLFIAANMGSGLVWIDISSVGSGGNAFTANSSPPGSPAVGDEWYSTTEEVLYKRVSNGSFAFWMQIS